MNLREEKSIIEMERNESIAVLESSTSASSNEEGESEPERFMMQVVVNPIRKG